MKIIKKEENLTKAVKKAVIPVAGLGTRFLPATKSMPKEMLTIVDKPVVHYAVDEALEAGIEHIVFVTGRNKSAIEDYFDAQPELMDTLRRAGKAEQITVLETLLPKAGSISYTRQQVPLGLGHAVWCARDIVGAEPFALLLPDMVSYGARGALAGVKAVHDAVGGNVLAVEECDPTETKKYGIVGKGEPVAGGFRIDGMVEKPEPTKAPSNFYISGRYILQPEIFDILEGQERGAGNEIQLTDAMVRLAEHQTFHAAPYDGRTFDCGSKQGFIEANVAFALARDDIAEKVFDPLVALLGEHRARSKVA